MLGDGAWDDAGTLHDARGGTGAATVGDVPCVTGGEEDAGTIGSVECRVDGGLHAAARLGVADALAEGVTEVGAIAVVRRDRAVTVHPGGADAGRGR